ncbi:hypothetical protein [Pseudonocardia lacus]|uniref:hypothetical protein n=1 Tax=Pseudonocardia lacus TaxID=2835865 RepID=UPI001BDCE7F5|nr:hypothetical protein [Pseudonocardia lacus]
MLKKAGIVVAVAIAGLVSVSPLAFATEGHDDHDRGHGHHHSAPRDIDYTNVEEGNLRNDCAFGQAGPQVRSSASGGSSLLGVANLVTDIVAPITAQTQLLNCNNINVSDVIDLGSNNTDVQRQRTEVEGSFNRSFNG